MKRKTTWLLAATTLLGITACTGGTTDAGDGTGKGDGSGSGSDTPTTDEWDAALSQRSHDYSAALRIAALRLTGDLPTMTEINAVASATDDAAKKTAYETLVKDYLGRPSFARQALFFWRDTFKMGGTNLDTAPAFAAQLTAENRSYLELLTATTGNCPTVDVNAGTFAAANCNSGAPAQAGVLTDANVMRQFFSNMAFRRVDWVQKVFACTKFPVEVKATPEDIGNPNNLYTNPWPIASIKGNKNGGRVDFHDVSAVVCANCHSTMNHIAPLFANFDNQGRYQAQISVPTPLTGTPVTRRDDYLPEGEATAWRQGKPAADLPALGAAMAADPAIAECAVARAWNWALGKGDIVDALHTVPSATITAQVAAFTAGGHKLKDLIYAVYTSDDFTKF